MIAALAIVARILCSPAVRAVAAETAVKDLEPFTRKHSL